MLAKTDFATQLPPAAIARAATSAVSAAPPLAEAPATVGLQRDALNVANAPRELKNFAAYLEDQDKDGPTNGCGTTTLGMIMSFWEGKPGAWDRKTIDQVARQGDNTTSIHRLRSYARDHGMRSQAQNNASLDDLKKYLDLGVPVQVLIEPGSNKDWMMHYVNVIGYESDDKGRMTSVTIADPQGGEIVSWPTAEFEKKWSHLELGGIGTGINHVMLVHLPQKAQMVKGRDGQVRSTDEIALPQKSGLGIKVFLGHLFLESKNLIHKLFH